MKRIMFLAMALTGCGNAITSQSVVALKSACNFTQAVGSVDYDLSPYVRMFYDDADLNGVPTCMYVDSVTFADKLEVDGQKSVVGLCTTPPNGVQILRSYFNEVSEWERMTLIYHELGHCALGLAHADPEAVNIMAPSVLPDYKSEPDWSVLVKKLFTLDMSLVDVENIQPMVGP